MRRPSLPELLSLRRSHNASVAISPAEGETEYFYQRGVTYLFYLLSNRSQFLKGAQVADKVVGKGAAALLVEGGVEAVYADVMSKSALKLLRESGIPAFCGVMTEKIRNRTNTGFCPVETLCANLTDTHEMAMTISNFIKKTV